MQNNIPVSLQLENGKVFQGKSFGYEQPANGELVFSTAMVGYPESLTDPSCSGQILVATYPLVGNYGVPEGETDSYGLSTCYESEHIHVRAFIVSDYSFEHSHWSARKSLAQWLKEEKITGVYGIDTRALAKILREEGSMQGKILFDGLPDMGFSDSHNINRVTGVSCKTVMQYVPPVSRGGAQKRIVLVDCGVKHNILRYLLLRGATVIRVPWDYDFTAIPYDGLFISNGPGNPDLCEKTVANIRKAMAKGRPIFGVGMGNLLLSKAAGARIYKLKCGHRSHNQPVRIAGTHTCFITSQNHGYAVDNATLPEDWEPWLVNMNDGSNEGIRHRTRPFFAAQFYPEISSEPNDTGFLYDQFLTLLQSPSRP